MTSRTSARKWAESFFDLVDLGDVDGIAAAVAEHCALTSGNEEPVVGRDAIRAVIRQFRTTIRSLRHHVVRAWSVPEGVIVELRVSYVRLDGGAVTLPCTNIFDLDDDGLVTHYEIFMDMGPVYA